MPKLLEMPEAAGFDKLLETAEDRAMGDWEMNFVSETRERYDKYGDNTYLSDKQIAILKRIAEVKT